MREAIGGVFQLQIAITLIVILLVVFSFGIKYVQAFRTKNFIINQLEIHEGLNDDSGAAIVDFIESTDYFRYTNLGREDLIDICYEPVDGMGHKGIYYRIRTLINYNMPVVDTSLSFNLRGETRMIYTSLSDIKDEYDYGVNETLEAKICK